MSNAFNKLYEFDEFLLDSQKLILTRNGIDISLPPKAVELLIALIEQHGEVVEKDVLIKKLWTDTIVEDSNLTQNMYLLRKALGEKADGQPYIKTFSKRGYKFIGEVSITEEINEEKGENVTDKKERQTNYQVMIAAGLIALFLGIVTYSLFNSRQNKSVKANSIAVIPFKIIDNESNDSFLGLGMADAIITRLGKTGKVQVSPTMAIKRYGEEEKDPLTVGKDLNVEAVLSGNIQRIGERIRVTVQFTRISDNKLLWTEQFDKKFTDIFAVQDLISQKVAKNLTLSLTEEQQRALTVRQTDSIEAYELYLKGRFYWAKRTPEWIRKGIECFNQAIQIDPKYAAAYAGLADSYAVTASGLPPAERFPKAKANAVKALELDESLAEAHTSLAFVLYKTEWKWAEAEQHFKRAIELNPSYSLTHHWFGEFLGLRGRFDEGIAELLKAGELDPLSLPIKTDTGRIYYRAGRFDEAIKYSQQTLDLDPNYRNALNTLVYVYEQQQMFDKAVDTDIRSMQTWNITIEEAENLRKTFAEKGWKDYWKMRFELMQKYYPHISQFEKAEIFIRIDEKKEALKILETSFANRDDGPLFFKAEPLLDTLRSEPEFIKLMDKTENTSN